jgi:GAF domain-containing protein
VGHFAIREPAPGSPMNSGKKGTPVLDEATFQKLLAAAYVLQEHHDHSQPPQTAAARSENPDRDSDTSILAQIVEIQHEIQTNHLDLEATTNLIAERILRITGAQGAAIGVLQDSQLFYRAARGILASQLGKTLRPEATLSGNTVLHDVILRCTDASADFRVNPEITKRSGISSLISVPVLNGGKTGGTLELAYSAKNAFQDQDVRTCQLMAGLLTEALTRSTEEEWRKGLAAERASMLEVLEKIKPQLARLANSPEALSLAKSAGAEAQEPAEQTQCGNCGREMGPEELFCGSCGTSRTSVSHNDLQSKWATLWNLQKAAQDLPAPPPVTEDPDALIQGLRTPDGLGVPTEELRPLIAPSQLPSSERPTGEIAAADPPLAGQAAVPTSGLDLTETEAKGPDDRVWFHSIAVSPPAMQLRNAWQKYSPFVRKHRGDLALGASLLLFLITILWAVSAQKPTTSADTGNSATAATTTPKKQNRKPAPPKLSFFDQMLVDMGLAEPPPAPSYSGNPDVPVWIDVQSAVYYCPGSDLYGKTPQGRIASQRDAQQDQFEPASRKVCE